ncbi:SET domain-containing protein-lysine N-methyltransferase [Flavobacterium tibetense]|uniref:SET domain-containing protein-lysine N-methyltransferase n=1 Tax=Flavobacterium tibetense TaxID=2233533 RepID=UPI001EFD6759|nr:SET domain-containing protein-lysine N-methyltransferase [Flavobacterium tibetense]
MKIEAPESDYLFVQDSQLENAGKGLFTAITIYPNEIISIFKGEILTEKEVQKRSAEGNDRYFINMLDGSTMDSMYIDCFAKYANDAQAFTKTGLKNNAKISLDDDDNVCLMATRKINPMEEIFCSYGAIYWKKYI